MAKDPDSNRRGPGLTLEQQRGLRNRLIARDETALVELIELASPWLLGLAQSMLSDWEESEEVVQDAFRIAWQKVGTLTAEDDQRILPWLFKIVRNRAIDRIRARKRFRDKVALARTYDDRSVSAPVEPDESTLPGWHVYRSVHAALAALPEEQRMAVHLAYFRGLTQSEIAEHLGIPLGTVKTRLRLAFDKLRGPLASLKDWLA